VSTVSKLPGERVREHERESPVARGQRLWRRAHARDRKRCLVERRDRKLVQRDFFAVDHAARDEREQRIPVERDGLLGRVAVVQVVGEPAGARAEREDLAGLERGPMV
jgi:hypothetical protein